MKIIIKSVLILFISQTVYSQKNKIDSIRNVIDSLSINLKEVSLKDKRQIIDYESDRFIFNVENSTISKGSNALDILRRTPLVNIDSDKILVLGSQNPSIYINNKKSILIGKDLLQYLKSIPSENIKKIEVITSPSARYEGNENIIINIILIKNENEGLNGNLSVANEQSKKNSQSSNLNLNFKKNNYSQNVILYYSENNSITKESLFNNYINLNDEYINRQISSKDKYIGGITSINYDLNEHNRIGASLEFKSNHLKSFEESNTYYTDNSINSSKIVNKYNNKVNSFGSNLYYSHIDKKKSLDINLDYTTNIFNSNNLYNFNNNELTKLIITKIYNESIKNNYSLKIDYNYEFSFLNLELGAKSNLLKSNNPYKYLDWKNDDFIENNLYSNKFNFQENINAFYFNLKKKLFNIIDLSLGVRYENSNLTINNSLDNKNKSHFNHILPTINSKILLNKNNILSISYRSMIWRPYPNELNPFISKINETFWSTGNPNLNYAKLNVLRGNYIYKKKLMFLFGLETVKDPIINSIIESNGINISKPQNFKGVVKRYSLTGNYSFSILNNNIATNISSGLYYIDNSSIYPDNENSFYNNSSLNIEVKNFLKSGISINTFINYKTSYYLVNKFNKSIFYTSIDFSKNYKDLVLKISLNDPFNLTSNKYNINSEIGDFYSSSDLNQRSILFSITKYFGNKKMKTVKTNKIEKERIQEGSSIMK